jgi:hypothetical protein
VSDLAPIGKQKLTPAGFSDLADVPPELGWLGDITGKEKGAGKFRLLTTQCHRDYFPVPTRRMLCPPLSALSANFSVADRSPLCDG